MRNSERSRRMSDLSFSSCTLSSPRSMYDCCVTVVVGVGVNGESVAYIAALRRRLDST